MEFCARCRKELKGYFEKIPVVGVFASKYPEYNGKQLCEACRAELLKPGQAEKQTANPPQVIVRLGEEVNKAIVWQKDEILIDQWSGKEFFEDRAVAFGARVGHNGCLVVTNQRILFACKVGLLAKDYGIMYSVNLEDITSVCHGRFGINDKLIILDKNGQHRDFVWSGIQSLVPKINSAIPERKRQIQAEKEKERVQIILDFSALKDTLSKGGVVMTAYNCPNCSAMVDLPEAGKVLICKHCGTPIKPVDIFEKIKSLL